MVLITKQNKQLTKDNFFTKIKKKLLKTKKDISINFFNFFYGKKIDYSLFNNLEEQLLIADIGIKTTKKIINNLIKYTNHKALDNTTILYSKLREEMANILLNVNQKLTIHNKLPHIILIIGVNGVGKTTTIGKLSHIYKLKNKTVMLAAGDTYRVAAIEQLQFWGNINKIPVISQHTGADPASVIFDAINSAKAKKIDILIADTAGRLQNKLYLIEELKKIIRVIQKIDQQAPHEIILVLDASMGQNSINQVKIFHEAVKLTGIILTKFDGTAKGGIIFAIADQFKIPINYIGIGEEINDLKPFIANDFIESIFTEKK